MRQAAAVLMTSLLFVSCISCTHVTISPTRVHDDISSAQFAANYRIEVECEPDGKMLGSAVAVSSRHFLSAHHVVSGCAARGLKRKSIYVISRESRRIKVKVARASSADDVVLLRASRPAAWRWSSLSDRIPHPGERVCIVSSTGTVHHIRKCGQVFEVSRRLGKIAFSIHTVPGNSGAPVYDADGDVIGIVGSGRWFVSDEFYGSATMPRGWRLLWPH